jgi:protoporphyrinogen IX oxidase
VPWLPLSTALVAVHVVANLVWIGAILSVALLVSNAPFMADPTDPGALARRVYVRLAAPAFVVSFATGVGRIALFPMVYAHMPWLHVKLALALVVIALHHVIGARAKRLRSGETASARGVGLLGFVLFAFAASAAVLGVAKSLP